MKNLKEYKVIATVNGMREPFVDWYTATSKKDCLAQWLVEAEKYMGKETIAETTTKIIEVK